MTFTRLSTLLALSAVALGTAPAAANAQAAPNEMIGLRYDFAGVSRAFVVHYTGGVTSGLGGQAQTTKGALSAVLLVGNGVFLDSSAGAVNGTADHLVTATTAPVTGVAQFPSGTATVTNDATGTKLTLTSGQPFTIPTGITAGAAPLPAGPITAQCRGSATTCQATVPVAGGANERPLSVTLPAAGMYLARTRALPSTRRAAHHLAPTGFSQDGRTHTLTLRAARANKKGARVVLTYKRARR